MFEAVALSKEFQKGRKSGFLEIRNGDIIFTSNDGEIFKLNLNGVEISKGGAGNNQIYFKNSSNSNLTFYTEDHKILNHPELKTNFNLKSDIKKIKTSRKWFYASVLVFVVLFLGAFSSVLIFRKQIIEKVANQIPPSVEQSISEKLKESILKQNTLLQSGFLDSQLSLITSPLVNAYNNDEFKFSFNIIEDETMNAFALPGGVIMINSGLIEKAENAEEVAGVLAHEISHVTRRHHIRGIIGSIGVFTLIKSFFGDISGISSEIIAIGASLESMKYSRDYETESDNSGFELLIKANINPQGMIDFFEKLEKEHSSLEMSEFLSTHPATKERINNLNKKLKHINNTEFQKININFETFKQEIKKLDNSKVKNGNKN